MNEDELRLLNKVVGETLEWYNTNALTSGATLADFLMDVAIKLEEEGSFKAKDLLAEAAAAGFEE
ncbi:MAG: hypothetical protein Q6370_012360 [Candidatus Sigynarchaeota archaeon]